MANDRPAEQGLTLFSRLPLPGQSKTRLIPGVGAERAAELHRAMSLRAITTVRLLQARHPEMQVALSLAGPPELAERHYGAQLPVTAQPGGDLGERMAETFRSGREAGLGRHVIIGSDAPALDTGLLEQALSALGDRDLVLGPARDGGYYLIGLSVPPPPGLFSDMPWGGPEVLGLTLARAQSAGLSLQLLPTLDDVDHPQDLRHWRRLRRRWPALRDGDGVSVVMPVLNEAGQVGERVRTLLGDADEVIVVDGGSHDGSADEARQAGARVLATNPGRGRQMNAGARAARCPALLFLHADTRLAPGWRPALMAALADSRCTGGAFRFRLDGRGLRYRLLEWLVALRCHLLKRPYGDQGLFCRSEAFLRLGGFPEVPVMEDYLFVSRLRREGRIRMLPLPATSSARNWQRAGFWRVALAHRLVLIGHRLGIPLDYLARLRQRLLTR